MNGTEVSVHKCLYEQKNLCLRVWVTVGLNNNGPVQQKRFGPLQVDVFNVLRLGLGMQTDVCNVLRIRMRHAN